MSVGQLMKNIIALRMERQFLTQRANEEEYEKLFRDVQPGQSIYWHGFGQPPVLSFRADFDDMEYNRIRQMERKLVKGRFQGGNVGWIEAQDMELFAGLCCKPITQFTFLQEKILRIIEEMGPVTIQQIKEETGLLVKEITPILHKLQEAFLIYEDQYDGDWERGWYRFGEMFPDVDLQKYTKQEAMGIVIQRFANRMVYFTPDMIKNYYKLPVKEIKQCIANLLENETLMKIEDGYMLREDYLLLEAQEKDAPQTCYLMQRNDILIKSIEPDLKKKYHAPGFEALYYIVIQGEVHGAVIGKYKFGPDIIENVMIERSFWNYIDEIIQKLSTMPGCTESTIKNVTEIEWN